MGNHPEEVQSLNAKERFWIEQNQKLIANDLFLDKLGNLYDDVLHFSGSNRKVTIRIDFSVFTLPHINVEDAATLTCNGEDYSLTLKEYAKLSVINSITAKSAEAAKSVFYFTMHLGAFFNTQTCKVLSRSNISAFHMSYLTQYVNREGWFTRLSPPSYKCAYSNFSIVKSRRRLQALGVSGILDKNLTTQNVVTALDNSCRTLMNITLPEYKKGGSLNTLTLEMGQYYVDYLKQTYEKGFFYALTCKLAIDSLHLNKDIKYAQYRVKVVSDTIIGNFHTTKYVKIKSPGNRNALHSKVKGLLFEQYLAHFEKVMSLREASIRQVVAELRLDMRFDAIEVVRVLMMLKYYDLRVDRTPESVWRGYLRSLNKTHIEYQKVSNVTVADVYSLMSKVVAKHRMTKCEFIASLNQWAMNLMGGNLQATFKQIKWELERIFDAMTSLAVSWLGYRGSEYGFPLNAIHVEPNLDVLDNSYVPFRFKLKWLVPKTNKATKIDREITSQCYQIAAELNEVFKPNESEPCLYAFKGFPISNESMKFISSRIKSNWSRFVNEYQPFKDIDQLERLSGSLKNSLSSEEKAILSELVINYDLSSARAQHLLAASKEVKQDIQKLNCTGFSGVHGQRAFKASLVEFRETGKVSNQVHKQLIKDSLSDETKEWLQSDKIKLDPKSVKA